MLSAWHSVEIPPLHDRRGASVPACGTTGDRVRPYTFTIRLPRFSPASSPISAFGVFSRPSMTSSCTFSLPEATQDCRSARACVALVHVVHHDEALHDQALHHDQAGHAARAGAPTARRHIARSRRSRRCGRGCSSARCRLRGCRRRHCRNRRRCPWAPPPAAPCRSRRPCSRPRRRSRVRWSASGTCPCRRRCRRRGSP